MLNNFQLGPFKLAGMELFSVKQQKINPWRLFLQNVYFFSILLYADIVSFVHVDY